MFWLSMYLLGCIAALIALFYYNRFFRLRNDLPAIPLSEGVVLALLSWAITIAVSLLILSDALDDTRFGRFFARRSQ